MTAEEKQREIESTQYWDARVVNLQCNYFADEVYLEFEDNPNNISLCFLGCYKVIFNHSLEYAKEKPSKELSVPQIPYFLQDISVSEDESGLDLYVCRISMPPLSLEVWCKNIQVNGGAFKGT